MNVIKRFAHAFDPVMLLTLIVCAFTLWPLLYRAGLPNGDDVLYHVYRAAEMDRAWAHGVYMPRWAEAFYEGYGAPLFHYYASLTYYSTSILTQVLGTNAVDSLRTLIALGALGGGLGMYGFVRAYAGKAGGVIAAICYVYSPYILFTEPYSRGAYPELMAFALFPLVMWTYSRLTHEGGARAFLLAAVGSGALIITHNLMALVLTAVLAAWIVWGFIQIRIEPQRRREGTERRSYFRSREFKNSLLALLALAIGIGLTAYFWLPVAKEGDAVKLSNLIGVAQLDYRRFFVPVLHLLDFSPRLDGGAFNGLEHQLNLGVAQWVLALAGVIGMVGVWVWNRRTIMVGAQSLAPLRKPIGQVLFFGVMSAVFVGLMLPAAGGLWAVLSPLAFLQFPWRLLGPAAFCLSVLAGMNALWLERLPKRFGVVLAGGVVVLVIVLASPLLYVPEWTHTTVDTSVTAYQQAEVQGLQRATTFSNEYLPKSVSVEPAASARLMADYADGYPINKADLEALPADVTVTPMNHTPQEDVWTVKSPNTFTFEVLTYYWLGWAAEVDGQAVMITPSDQNGLITLPVPAGEHTVRVYLGSTPARDVGNAISLLSVVGLVGIGGFLTQRHKATKTQRSEIEPPSRQEDLTAETQRKESWSLVGGIGVGAVVALVFLVGYMRESGAWVVSPVGQAVLAQHKLDYRLGEQIRLIGYDLNGDTFRAGDRVEIKAYWYTTAPIQYGYASFVHISTGGPPLAQADKLNPADIPTKIWPSTGYLHDDYVIELPADMPAGEYQLLIGLYTCDTRPAGDCGNGDRLTVTDASGQTVGDEVKLATITIR
ncbi:MAG: glycosyltransferase family 39 protein [Anaerolineae bacterium]|nr:glycosyltransferase family 39 protein [Anaerolineae bacterium]